MVSIPKFTKRWFQNKLHDSWSLIKFDNSIDHQLMDVLITIIRKLLSYSHDPKKKKIQPIHHYLR